MAESGKNLVIISGPLYNNTPKMLNNGSVAVPIAFFKIIYNLTDNRAEGYIVLNKKVKTEPGIKQFKASIDMINQYLGFEFLLEVK